ncbi:MAG TPA: dihydroxyacetone kinase family protein [Actinotalea caeni]|uniref:dihydroxyacetone kinase family protein n=1 Tax=Actinotalea caeni TaxID=1348467 RepID=UPI0012E0E1F7|nr:dihydroxyacetone kinase family protein [Actinotalea caeni]HLV55855.1 dihydroxyacetone kinase family protein [Actinotalea caeni]
MTHLVNDPKKFAADVLAGFVRAHADRVMAVHGGAVRATETPQGEVAVVLGGGSGHYPAFAGWIGEGMAHGAVCGNIFASPSASQAASVARAAHAGGGVLFGFGNYAGDVLQFSRAVEMLAEEGIEARILTVTDDIASADTHAERRGIAGDLPVFKIAGAAAAQGWSLDEVERVTRHANDRTFTIGVAMSGCTLPGADAPLFTVPEGSLAIGLGIHGEPGLSEVPLGTAQEVADDLVDRLLAAFPDEAGDRVAILVNGLGATTYEEQFVVFARVADRFEAEGFTLVEPEVGEHVTSLDMAGLSVTAMLLDDELEPLWRAPVDTPAFRRGSLGSTTSAPPRRGPLPQQAGAERTAGAEPSQRAAAVALARLDDVVDALKENEAELGKLDAVAGDGDHGQGMVLGAVGAADRGHEAAAAGVGLGTLLREVGEAWAESAGGTSGALWGAALVAAGERLGDTDAPGAADVAEAVSAAVGAMKDLGKAELGDKTLMDAAVPFAEALAERVGAGEDLATAWSAAAARATEAAEATAQLQAKKGRAKTHGDHSVGHADPGATSFALVCRTVADKEG